jgi:hypothetical protein
MPYLERHNVPVPGPLLHHGFEYLGHLVHLDVQASLAGLDLVLRLQFVCKITIEGAEYDAPSFAGARKNR